jgi:alpha-glucosidase (family GH31 glycosyl hydrolase)
LTITNKVPSANPSIYGLGERAHNFRLDTTNKTYSFQAIDRYVLWYNLYGVHPFYIEKRRNKAYGLFLLNSNSQNVLLKPYGIKFRVKNKNKIRP